MRFQDVIRGEWNTCHVSTATHFANSLMFIVRVTVNIKVRPT